MKLSANNLQKFLNIAIDESISIQRQFKHVSIITNIKGHILSVGTNRTKTHTFMVQMGYPMAEIHSEVDAFRKLDYNQRKKRLTLVNFRLNRDNLLRLSKPCKYCLPWCLSTFEDIFYTTDEGFQKV